VDLWTQLDRISASLLSPTTLGALVYQIVSTNSKHKQTMKAVDGLSTARADAAAGEATAAEHTRGVETASALAASDRAADSRVAAERERGEQAAHNLKAIDAATAAGRPPIGYRQP